ncbi:hypothetical protein [Sulfuriferula nivalis]|uniref:Uncharacterized protein n=1 Tax=Sulfuriferula nivalis TaxID=2675298 RepID=A0A809RNZ5_9PROT|nr:hypothetical protein [Sulfuriferula nivalis]BBP02504.1 hypothetical protein SFSGTM_32120 [Sulfuriferula nivalis]
MTEPQPSAVQKRPQINHALFLFDKKTAWMQRLADLSRYGYSFYIQGQISREKAYFMAEKFALFYGTGLGRMEQSRLRKQGQATFRFLAWHDEKNDVVHWVLLRTDGSTPEQAARENWRSLVDDRLVVVGGYELVRVTKVGTKKPVWTWRYTKAHYAALRESLIGDIRGHRDLLTKQLIHEIWRTPGFSAAREQVKQLKTLILAEWKRSRGTDPLPEIPARLGYVRKLADKGTVMKKTKVKK